MTSKKWGKFANISKFLLFAFHLKVIRLLSDCIEIIHADLLITYDVIGALINYADWSICNYGGNANFSLIKFWRGRNVGRKFDKKMTGAMTGDWHILICITLTYDLHTDQLEIID